LPLIEKLKKENYPIELVFFYNVPNKEITYYQAQIDIIVDLLTFGWFGATIREGLMMGKVCVCYIRPKWAEYIAKTFPEYADYIRELPVISATPDTIEEVLRDLLDNPEKRVKIGKRSREFAIKWHSSKVAAEKLDRVYSMILEKANQKYR
jgi:glycosyltransferase involved in cell wall biosynthesis